ncbi:hypothetical protein LCGC14_2592040 [marine sediment metagenome]|uniref:Uncharacterized protein n=2 Tax=root TaxID=1 RepID=A0A831QPY3_9FLAO|nr:hypothetical protein [Pricia antarctica]
MTYQQLLESKEWREKRKVILKRDLFQCQQCNNSRVINQLHSGKYSNIIKTKYHKLVKIDSIEDGIGTVSTIDEETSKFLDSYSMIYYGQTLKGQKKVYGIRTLNPVEKEVFKSYASAWKHLFKNPFEDNLEAKFKQLTTIRASWISKLKEVETKFSELDWKIMTGLHIHHEYYIKNKLPWNYENDALITLCMDCHEELHKNKKVPVYSNELELIGELTNCYRCHGAGWFPEYLKVENGICFRCRGAKYEEITNANNSNRCTSP